jgi:hypothetical protein
MSGRRTCAQLAFAESFDSKDPMFEDTPMTRHDKSPLPGPQPDQPGEVGITIIATAIILLTFLVIAVLT